MGINISANAVISSTWLTFKTNAVTGNKSLPVQYTDDGTIYTIFTFDNVIAYTCIIWKGTVPDPVIASGYSQAQNDSDKSDFETNYKPTANKSITAILNGVVNSAPVAETAFGYVASSAKAATAVRATTYTQISGAPVQVSVKSASANDTSAGTGARTITITYLTTGLARKTETITMNGATAVNSVGTDYAFIEKVICSTAGSGRTNAGIITVFQGTGGTGTALCSIAASDGRTNLAQHYITTGKSCYVTNLTASTNAGTNGLIMLQITNNGETDVLLPVIPGFRLSAQETSFTVAFNPPVKVPDSSITNGNLLIAYVVPDATTATNWYVSFSYLEV